MADWYPYDRFSPGDGDDFPDDDFPEVPCTINQQHDATQCNGYHLDASDL